MLALSVEFLTGRFVATAYDDRSRPEWPPHPARVYSALVEAWATDDEGDELKRSALRWLASIGAPEIAAGGCFERDAPTHFVPVNDISVVVPPGRELSAVSKAEKALEEARRRVESDPGKPKSIRSLSKAEKTLADARRRLNGAQQRSLLPNPSPSKKDLKHARLVMPESRLRQGRRFPSVTPENPHVHYVWHQEPPPDVRHALAQIAERAVRLGHSSSLVHCRFVDEAPEPNWLVDAHGAEVLRVPGPEQLELLERAWMRHQGVEPRVLPCRFQRYRRKTGDEREHEPPRSAFDDLDWVVFRRVGDLRLPLTRCVDVALALRGALIHHCEEPVPELLSGHGRTGEPSQRIHAACVALPFVAHEHADGSILGVALISPREADPADWRCILRAIGRWEATERLEDEETPRLRLNMGRAGHMDLERIAWGRRLLSLRPGTWCQPARRWISATPMALDENPKDLRARDPAKVAAAQKRAAVTIELACERIGLPRPIRTVVLPSVSLPGTAKARQYPPFPPQKGRLKRAKVHAAIEFGHPVRGPLLLGAGRYLGLGLFRPIADGGTA